MVAFVSNTGLAAFVAAIAAFELHVQFGTGSAQDAADNELAAAVQERQAGVVSQQTTSVAGDTLRVEATITADAVHNITEVGLFDAAGSGSPASGGNMLVYGDFTEVTLANGDAIEFTIDVVFA